MKEQSLQHRRTSYIDYTKKIHLTSPKRGAKGLLPRPPACDCFAIAPDPWWPSCNNAGASITACPAMSPPHETVSYTLVKANVAKPKANTKRRNQKAKTNGENKKAKTKISPNIPKDTFEDKYKQLKTNIEFVFNKRLFLPHCLSHVAVSVLTA